MGGMSLSLHSASGALQSQRWKLSVSCYPDKRTVRPALLHYCTDSTLLLSVLELPRDVCQAVSRRYTHKKSQRIVADDLH